MRADLKAAEKLRRARYTATTTPDVPRPRRTVTGQQARAEIARAKETDLAGRALPDLIPPRDPPADWARPRPSTAAGLRPGPVPRPSVSGDATGTAPASHTEE
ncbi:hypothetical protein [Streptomyces sp. DH24]|uniref:hypothetical protein n=1 Tax=Streptomyces sp. DH24 TaxID=3040123 RepID=UPI002442FD5E|nr:hypothetical protein [Streptomyces sp. DH24]MDG9720109.1 hypothetical protein [Streptomyces sp. DH24]